MTSFSSNSADEAAVTATNTSAGASVWGETTSGRSIVGVAHGEGTGVWGDVVSGRAVVGVVRGEGAGVWGDVVTGRAVVGAVNGSGGTGVWGETTDGVGVTGKDNGGGDGVVGEGRRGVVGRSPGYQGVYGWSRSNAGVVGESEGMHGVFGVSNVPNFAGVFGTNRDPAGLAGAFVGRVEIANGNLVIKGGDIIMANADCAEDFDVLDDCEPGTVMVATDDSVLRASDTPYDRRVAGVVSGAGCYRPGIILDRVGEPRPNRAPIALVGKVFCKVDASINPIAVGDLLTTSAVPGHAMKAADPARAFGAVIGKSLAPLREGRGLVPVLVALQ